MGASPERGGLPASRRAKGPGGAGAVPLSIPIRASSPPPLHELPEGEFEDLCRDLFEREANIATCGRFGTRGQTQLGIDLLASVKNSPDHHVAQCKCSKSFPGPKIKEASDEFLRHLAYWKERRVVRFVLIVSEPMEKTGQREQAVIEQRRFQAEGIRYEIWSLNTLLTRLRPWPELVERYIDQGRGGSWIDRICGPPTHRLGGRLVARRGATTPKPSLEPQFAELMKLAAQGLTSKLDECRSVARRGLIAQAEATLANILWEPATAQVMPVAVHARGLRLQASLALDRPNGEAAAKTLLAEAERLDGTPAVRLHAQIILNEQGPGSCLDYLQANGDGGEDDLCLRAVCHLRTGRAEAAVVLLEPLIRSAASADPERLLALALSASACPEQACTHAYSAHAREPEGWATRIALGVVLYSASLSKVVARGSIAGWPEPCDWHLVLRDDASVARLRAAEEVFASLISDKQERIDRQTLQAWRLACLANDSERQAEAQSFCREIMRECPTNAAAVAWAMARAFPMDGKQQVFDPAAVERALENLLLAGRGDLLQLMVLASLMSWTGKSSKVMAMLGRHQRHFAAGGSAEHFAMILAEARLRSGGALTDVEVIDLDRLAMLRLEGEADPAGKRDRLVAIARRLHEDGVGSQAFTEALFRMGTLGLVSDVAPFADRLVELVGTADAVRLAAHAKASVDDHVGTVALLDSHVAFFAGGLLPRGLRVLRAQCNERLGRLPEAIAEMQSLRGDGEAAFEVLGLADMYIRRGDLALAADAIAGIVDDPGVTPEQALRFAYVLGNDAPAVATRLWRRAVAQEIEAELLPTAITIAHRLALGPESTGIMARMAAQAVPMGEDSRQAHVVSMSVDQVLEFLRGRRNEMERFARQHEAGTIPVHLLAPQMGWSLARLFHEAPARRERTGSTDGMLLAAHGGRTAGQAPQDPGAWRLHVDITAILMAHHLGVLDSVERCFRPLKVSSDLVPSLIAMRSELLDENPDEAEATRDIISQVDAGRVLLADQGDGSATIAASAGALLDAAAALDGAALLWDEDARAAVAAGAAAVNLPGIVQSLFEMAEIDGVQASDSLVRLGTEGRAAPIGCSLGAGAVLVCHANTIQELARAKLLEPACRAFSVHSERSYVSHLRAGQLDGSNRRATADWVTDLLNRLNRGIQDRTYELLPALRTPELELGNRDGPTACLLDLLRVPAAEGNVIWIDDRALNAHTACGSAPLLGIADILSALRRFGRLTADEYHTRLLRLRAGQVAFLQAVDGELEFWLRRARVVGGDVVETDELSILRRYVARCISHEAILQIPPVAEGVPNPHGEVGFVIGWKRAVATTLTALWSDPALTVEQVLACSRWLWDNVAIARYERLPVFQATAEGRVAVLVADLSTLLCTGFLLLRPLCPIADRCANYMAWVGSEVVGPRLRADPEITQPLITSLATFLSVRRASDDEEARLIWRSLIARFLDKLPGGLRGGLMRNRAMLANLGFDQDLRVTQLGDLTFPAKAYLDALADAAERGVEIALIDESGVAATISAHVMEGQIVANVVDGRTHLTIADPVNNFLAGDGDARELLSGAPWLDAPGGRRRDSLDLLLATSDRAERVMAAIDLRAVTAGSFYDALQARLGRGEGISFEDLEPPSARSLLEYLRLPDEGCLSERIEAGAAELLDDYGIEEAFNRLAHLPTGLPRPFLDAFAALTPAQRLTAIEHWRSARPTPMQRIHIARLASMQFDGLYDELRTERALLELADGFANGDWGVFAALSKAIGARSAEWAGALDLTSAERIVACWCHAGALFKIIHPVVEPADLKALAERHAGDAMSAALADEVEFRSDVASPRFVSAEVLLIWGVAHSCDASIRGTLPESLRNLIIGLAVQDIGGTPFPQGSLLDAKWLRPDATGSFLAGSIGELIGAVTATDVGKWYEPAAQREMISQSLPLAGGDLPGLQAWRMVLCVMAIAAMPPEFEGLLVAAVVRSAAVRADADPELCHAILRFSCVQAAYSQSPELKAAAARLFDLLAPQLLDIQAGERSAKRCVWALLGNAIEMSRGRTGAPLIEEFMRSTERLAEGRPRAAEALRAFLGQAVRQIRFADAERLWPFLLELRAR